MRVVKLEGNGRVAIQEQPDPVAGPGEVVIKTAASALCGSEMHDYRTGGVEHGNNGHEAVGRVIQLGEGVNGLTIGQRVGVSAIAGCGQCDYCAKGQYTWCKSFRFNGQMHAEQFVIAANACHVLPDDVAWGVGTLLTGDGLGVPYHTSTKLTSADITTVAVFGVGPIGLGNVLVQSHLGRRLIAIDVSPSRLELAKRLGAQEIVNAQHVDAVKAVRELTNGSGADACIEAAGRQKTALSCFEAVRTAGTVIFNGEQGPLLLSPSDHFIRRDITAVGSWFYHYGEYQSMLNLFRNGLRLQSLITDEFNMEDAATAYAQFTAGTTGKVLLKYPD